MMNKYTVFLLSLLVAGTLPAQSEYADQYLGWMKMVKASDPVKPASYDNRNFTVKQLAHANLFSSWIQASYTPKGGLGEARKTANEKLSPYNQYTRSLHPCYGAYLPTYVFLKKKTGGGWTPENNLGLFLRFIANGLIGDHVDVICSPDNYYFYIPGLNPQDEHANRMNRFLGFDTHPLLSQYIHYYQPASIRYQGQYVAVLSKNNERPWVQITKKEMLEQLGKAIDRAHAENLKKINDDYDAKRKAEFLKNETLLYNKRQQILAGQFEKYKNRLDEKATMYTEQPSIHLENTPDLFEGNAGQNARIPVYKYDPAKLSGTKTDTPQWIVISWGGSQPEDNVFKHMHQSMLNNVDFTYIYNYFFDPVKTQGRNYQPLRSPTYSEPTVKVEESAASRKMKADPSVLIFEDFSSTAPGKTPVNWKSDNNANGEMAATEQPAGNNSQWVAIKGNKLTQKNKSSFPENFVFSCSIAVPEKFTWGAKRLTIKLGTDKASFLIGLRPGFDGNPGSMYIGPDQYGSTILLPGSLDKIKEIPVPDFSNNKAFNPIKLEVRKKGQSLEILINQTSAIHIASAFIQSNVKLQGIELAHSRSDAVSEKYYVTDILLLQ